jgi:uncharacterized membrane protein YbhN (UPF0104 family)
MRKKFSTFLSSFKWQDALKILLALVLMGIVLSRTSLAEIAALRDRLSWTWLAVSFIVFVAMTLLKTLQYWVLLGGRASYRRTLKIVIIQNALTNFVANSAGIASYLAMFQLEENVKVRQSGAVFVLTKAGDLFCMALYLLVSALLVWTRIGSLQTSVILLLAVVFGGLAVFWLVVLLRQTFVDFLRRLVHALRMDRLKLVEKGMFALETLSTQDTSTVLRVLWMGTLLSFGYMLATMLYGFSRVQTFQIPLDFWAIVFIASAMQFVSIIPVQVLGGLGWTEFTLVFLYGLFGVTQDIPAILVGLRILFYLFNLILLAYIPLDTLLGGKPLPAAEPQ